MGGPDFHKPKRIAFQKRIPTLLSKAHQAAKLLHADVYLVFRHPRVTFVYDSGAEGQDWPPDKYDLVVMLVYL